MSSLLRAKLEVAAGIQREVAVSQTKRRSALVPGVDGMEEEAVMYAAIVGELVAYQSAKVKKTVLSTASDPADAMSPVPVRSVI
jgi:Asp/Glu/hydantoin racemase